MCLKKNCRYIEIIEIHDNIKVVLHYNDKHKPILIQYWDETKPIHEQTLFRRKKEKPIELDFIDLDNYTDPF